MELLVGLGLIVIVVHFFNTRRQQRRIALLGSHLGNFQIEKLMEKLTDGYLRCLDEPDAERRAQIWSLLATAEQELSTQFARFSASFSRVDATQARVSKFPFADLVAPSATFDVRQAFAVHAQGVADAADNRLGLEPKAKAFMMSAELFLMQHTCHWFCRSKAVASARLLARHKTPYQLVVDSVSPGTRTTYQKLIGASA